MNGMRVCEERKWDGWMTAPDVRTGGGFSLTWQCFIVTTLLVFLSLTFCVQVGNVRCGFEFGYWMRDGYALECGVSNHVVQHPTKSHP